MAACSGVPIELVEVGILVPQGPEVAAWRFGAVDLMRARRLTRLQRDFGASTEAAAVILDLLDEIERLRAQLRRAGLEIG
ncbi:MAG: chaperone modulator CbpM [Gammaproteobacteria bacterium]